MGMCGLTGEMRNGDDSSNGAGDLGKLGNGVGENGVVTRHKSKNLEAERKRRKKLNEVMLELRSLVPKITNMNKATIIVDAVNYIQELQGVVEQLTSELQEMEVDEETDFQEGENYLVEAMTQDHVPILAEVEMTRINHTKLWMKLVCRNRRGGFAKLMEALNYLGLEPTDISLTTSGGAVLMSSCVEGIYGQVLAVDEIKQFLREVISIL